MGSLDSWSHCPSACYLTPAQGGFGEFMGAQVLKAFLKYPWLTCGMVQTALAGCRADVFAQYSQGHGSRVLPSTCLLLCRRRECLGPVCSIVSLLLPGCTHESLGNVIHLGVSSKCCQDFSQLCKFPLGLAQ